MIRPLVRRLVTSAELTLADALARVHLQQGDAGARRFVQAFYAKIADGVTEKQAAYLRRLVTKYRRQILPDSVPPEERHLLAPAGPVEAFRALDWPVFVVSHGFAHSRGEPSCGSLLCMLTGLAPDDVAGVGMLRCRILAGHRRGVLTLLGGERLGQICPGPGKVWGDVDAWIHPWWRARQAGRALLAASA